MRRLPYALTSCRLQSFYFLCWAYDLFLSPVRAAAGATAPIARRPSGMAGTAAPGRLGTQQSGCWPPDARLDRLGSSGCAVRHIPFIGLGGLALGTGLECAVTVCHAELSPVWRLHLCHSRGAGAWRRVACTPASCAMEKPFIQRRLATPCLHTAVLPPITE